MNISNGFLSSSLNTQNKSTLRLYISILLVIIGLSGCGGGGSDPSTQTPTPVPMTPPSLMPTGISATGEAFFNTKKSPGNSFSCANCHSTSEDSAGFSSTDSLHRPAHPLFNAVNRSNFYNQNTTVLMDAVNICLEDWMDADTLADGSQDWLDLNAYLVQESNSNATANITATQTSPITSFDDADIATGQTLFNQSCATCHNENALGSDIAPSLTTRNLSAERVAEKVRTSGPTTSSVFVGLTGGNMPFWSQERLSDDNLKHIASYVDSISIDPNATMTCSGNDHPKVGLIANLSTISHEVSGRAEIIDNCTIRISEFNYDGGGPDVFFYVAQNGDYKNGYTLGERINGQTYSNDTLTLSLASPSELDNIDGLSVWCVIFGVSFGDGLFQ